MPASTRSARAKPSWLSVTWNAALFHSAVATASSLDSPSWVIDSRRQFRGRGAVIRVAAPVALRIRSGDGRRDGRPGAGARQRRHGSTEQEEEPRHGGLHALKASMNGR